MTPGRTQRMRTRFQRLAPLAREVAATCYGRLFALATR